MNPNILITGGAGFIGSHAASSWTSSSELGIERKAQITARYLRRKMEEYENLKQEIAQLQPEMEAPNNDD